MIGGWTRRPGIGLGAVAVLILGAAAPAWSAPTTALIAAGDAAYERRAQGADGARAAAGPIGEAVAAYERALAGDPEDLDVRGRLLRALFFEGEYVLDEPADQLRLHLRARDLAEEGIAQLGAMAGGEVREVPPATLAVALADVSGARPVLFWAAVHWGLWARLKGKIAAARQGVAGVIRDYAERLIALDEIYEEGGGHRVLGRLHSEAPRIPFATGWVDRTTAVVELERALALAPENTINRLYLGEALVKHVPRRRAEGLAMLRDLASSAPRSDWLVEDAKAISDARARLQAGGR